MLSTTYRLFVPHHKNNHKPKILHTNSLLTLLGVLIMAQSVISMLSVLQPKILGFATNIDPEKIIILTNNQRLQNDQKSLTTSNKLNQAALAKASDMFASNYWSHASPSGTEPWYFISQADYQYKHAGENLARDFENSAEVVSAWMASPTHKKNILDSRFENIGVAVVNGTINGKETTLVVQMFGSSSSEQTSILGSSEFVSKAYATQDISNNLNTAISSFTMSKIISLSFIILLLVTLSLDWFFVFRKKLVRISGKSWAHTTFFIAILVVAIIIKHGIVL
ncbi:hypothetical protein KJ953_04720 [Patescibacteria group bacterium]|nr:hypothetical protein [Patescibacteria group bacterium]MBU1256129.1 hypothetical protein [Patescibacteria group bacterium]MBU1457325.1 hypothetical protein [Patescibacteria group bacterium]